MMDENHYTKEAYENNGRFQIHPLNSEGLEAYLSKDSYNYHFLKSRYDPALLKQVEEEMKAEREKKLQLKNQNQNISSAPNNIKENPKNEDVKIQNNPPTNVININNTKKSPPKNMNNNIKTGMKVGNKGNNNMKKKQNIGKNNNAAKKIGNVGHGMNPVISNVKNDRGRLKDFSQPYQA